MLLSNFPQGAKSFEKWSCQVGKAAKLIDYTNYDWKQAAVDAMVLQMSNSKLREKALGENVSYEELIKLGITKEQSEKGAALLEQASGQSSRGVDEEVRRLKIENKRLKEGKQVETHGDDGELPCSRCALTTCPQGRKCPANGQKCSKCGKMNHYARACRNPIKKSQKKSRVSRRSKNVSRLTSDSEDNSDSEVSNRIIVSKLSKKKNVVAKVSINTPETPGEAADCTGVSKTLINIVLWGQHQAAWV